MAGHILTLNSGSSSLKFSLFDAEASTCFCMGQIEGLGTVPKFKMVDGAGQPFAQLPEGANASLQNHAEALAVVLKALRRAISTLDVRAVGHRVVHGGLHFVKPAAVSGEVLDKLKSLSSLAPLHQPHNLAGIEAAQAAFPAALQVACFDTAFHRSHSAVEDMFALPKALYDEGVRRYGFHGISYEFVASQLKALAPGVAQGKVVICHLGSGASICAIRGGVSQASTMSFSTLDGLPMGTRPGQLDPGVILYLMEQKGMSASQVSNMLYKESGLKGLSGLSNDMRVLQASGSPQADLAIDYFTARIRREIGAMAAVLEGLDAIVFCGGIGENDWSLRQAVLTPLKWLGVDLDEEKNRQNASMITKESAAVSAYVIPTNEELMIARHTADLMRSLV